MKICEIYKIKIDIATIFLIFSIENLGLPTFVYFHSHEITGIYAKDRNVITLSISLKLDKISL